MLLRNRATHLREHMDDPNCDRQLLFRTYAQFDSINRHFCRWRTLFRALILPELHPERPTTVLDIGAGSGSAGRELIRLAHRHQRRLEVTAIDPDPRTAAWFAQHPPEPHLHHRAVRSEELLANRERFDLVISNHLLHHLTPAEINLLMAQAEQLANRAVLFNDLSRSAPAWLLFRTLAPLLYRNSFAAEDGARSIRRSYTPAELQRLARPGWQTHHLLPNRAILHFKPWHDDH